MRQILPLIFLFSFFVNADVVTDKAIKVTAKGLNKSLYSAITAGDIGGSGGGASLSVTAKTADYTLTSSDCEGSKTFTTDGASAAVKFTLPDPTPGISTKIVVAESKSATVQTSTGVSIFGSGLTGSTSILTTSTKGTSVRLQAISTTEWAAEFFGSWSTALFTGTSSDNYNRSDSGSVGSPWTTQTYHQQDSPAYLGISSNQLYGASGTNGRSFVCGLYDGSTIEGDWTYKQKVWLTASGTSGDAEDGQMGGQGICFGANAGAAYNSGVCVFYKGHATGSGSTLGDKIVITTGGFYMYMTGGGLSARGNGTTRSTTVVTTNDSIRSSKYLEIRKVGTTVYARLYPTGGAVPDWQVTYDYSSVYTAPSNYWGQIVFAAAGTNGRSFEPYADDFSLTTN